MRLPVIDFETYSEAKIKDVGAWAYAEHPSTEVLCLSWSLPGDTTPRLWAPELAPPAPLFAYIAEGGLLEAHNSLFEFAIWHYVCVCRMGWPQLPLHQLRDSAARVAAWSVPRKLENAGAALELPIQKDTKGHSVMLRVSKPRKPTKNKPWTRHTPENSPQDFRDLYAYCLRDWESETCLSAATPELSEQEERLWLLDQTINVRGVYVDVPLARACARLIENHADSLNAELRTITGGQVDSASCVQELATFAGIPNAQKATVADALETRPLEPAQRRALEIRQELGMASVKKVFAILDRVSSDSRLRGTMIYCGADRTGRWSGAGLQPQNLTPGTLKQEQVEEAISDIMAGRDLTRWGDLFGLISSLIRPMIRAAPGHELICSDYNAIEARVLAVLAGEEWRLEVFRTHGMIYEASASRITGVPFEQFMEHRKDTGEHHPLRKLGKVAELASGYQGWIGAWCKFGADTWLSEDDMKRHILAWREDSPMIPKLWEGLEGAAHRAVWNPGTEHSYRGLTYCVQGDVLYCRLPSGRHLNYHRPRLGGDALGGDWGLSYHGTDSQTKRWVEHETYGGKLTENVVQAVSRDILAEALPRVEAAGYPVVLHVHDELIAEVPEGWGSVEELERLMMVRPTWAHDWPIKASGGWRGLRYRKD